MAAGTRTRTLACAAALVATVVGCSQPPQATTPAPAPTSHAGAIPRQQTPSGCAVTIPNGNGPPGEEPSPKFHGAGALWTVLPADGIDRGGQPEPDGSTSQKYPWWTVGTTGQLTIQGRRPDTPAPTLRASVNNGAPESGFAEVPGGRFWASSLNFPTEGCWQVTGTVGHASLTFVVFKTTP
jgi:hypothetical protein